MGCGSAASGLVSMAVTKMAAGTVAGCGVLLNGRVRSAVHKPDDSNCAWTVSRGSVARLSGAKRSKTTCSSPWTSITRDCSTRRSPRLIADTVPLAGAVKRTPGFFLSSKRGWPFNTLSPSCTSMEGRMPTYSSPSRATKGIAGPS
ncbi:hypothetical protein D3C75_667810 [compost metagenome]